MISNGMDSGQYRMIQNAILRSESYPQEAESALGYDSSECNCKKWASRGAALRLAALMLAAVMLLACPLSAYAVSSADTGSTSEVSATDTEEELLTELGTVAAKAALLVDLGTGQILYEQNADEALPPASTTKIMTALLVLEAIEKGQFSADDMITAEQPELSLIPWDASTVNPRITAGEAMSVLDYLYCVMLSSDCACCNVLAKRVAGSVDDFVNMMNTRAAQLGCTGVTFLNAHGYPQTGHAASARSMYLITQEAMKHETFREIVASRDFTVSATDLAGQRRLINTNSLLVGSSGYSYIYATGVKTGYSKSSGYCLVATADNHGRSLMAVVLGAEKTTNADGSQVYGHFTEARRMLKWGFDAFSWQNVVQQGFTAAEVPLAGGELSVVTLVYDESALALLPVNFDMSTLEYDVTLYYDSAIAPVTRGDNFGIVDIFRDGELLASVTISAGADYYEKPTVDPTVMYIVLGGAVLAFICLIMAIKIGRSKNRYGYDSVPDPVGDPGTYHYGDRPLYNRRERSGPVAQPTYRDGYYHTSRPQQEPNDYYDNYRREYYRNTDQAYEEEQRNRRPEPIFPHDWKPPQNRG